MILILKSQYDIQCNSERDELYISLLVDLVYVYLKIYQDIHRAMKRLSI